MSWRGLDWNEGHLVSLGQFDLGTYGDLPLVHSLADNWSRPGLTNFIGSVQIEAEATAFVHPVFHPVSGAEERTCFLSIGGELLAVSGVKTEMRWTPYRVERKTKFEGWEILTSTAMVWGEAALVQRITIRNLHRRKRRLSLGVRISGRCVRDEVSVWAWGIPVVATDVWNLINEQGLCPVEARLGDHGKIWKERKGRNSQDLVNFGWNAQCLHPPPDFWNERNGDAQYDRLLEPGGELILDFSLSQGTSPEVGAVAKTAVKRVPEVLKETEESWQALWGAAFSAKNDCFSGSLRNIEVPREFALIGASALLNILVCRREKNGRRGYIVLTPRRCESGFFIWDWGLATPVLARLDPSTVRDQLAIVMASDYHNVNQYDLWTGKGMGWRYAANPCMIFLAAYSLWTAGGRDRQGLEQTLPGGGGTLLQVMEACASDFEKRMVANLGLADYGPKADLLECVTTYAHVVAGLNAAAAGMLLRLAEIYDLSDRSEDAGRARASAQQLADRIVEHLYVSGHGFFRCLYPDGRSCDCRSAFDVGMVLWQIGELLPEIVRDEISDFILRELRTPGWARALSTADSDAAVSGVRADHQYSGSYTAWPALLCLGLLKAGRRNEVEEWLRGIARTARQGPFGQGHWDEKMVAPTGGGATKVSDELPQGCHWCDISGAIYLHLLETMFPSEG